MWADLVGKVAVASNVVFVGASIQVLHATRGFAREVSDAGSQEVDFPIAWHVADMHVEAMRQQP